MELLQNPAFVRLATTVLLLLAVFAARWLLVRRIRAGSHILDEAQRRQLFYLRTAMTLVVLVGLVVIWAGALQNLVLSLTAVMVALVIATKELLMCLSGFLLRTTGRLFSVGDWIECHGHRGEVTDHSLLSTTLLEVESAANGYGYTGRSMILPNSLFLSHPVATSSFARQYLLHRFVITLEEPVDPAVGLERLQAETEAVFAPYFDDAQGANARMDRRLGVDVPGPEPRVTVAMSDIGKMQFIVMLFCPREQALALEREITTRFLHAAHAGELGGRAAETAALSPEAGV